MKMQPNSPTKVTPPPYEATTNNWPIILPYATDAGNMVIASLTFILFASHITRGETVQIRRTMNAQQKKKKMNEWLHLP
jgi:hypothetical protein